ncbi:urea ABC transporter permease subunit UrtB [Catenovulum sp. 2E275]|uniref:urea ABC transporter permease subunit UrtB n=1 Tax=Catenovulum sp. 2E275 TaxID=2980497 RepID=UPI0021D26F15|nr:urea ABC transporter permease subunit UrtB [Catenovulum sp. 2E275]MCU4676936.1 urea ABC transporter permease subunit UrtB [Catenovulum sp. 2E275]
MLRTFCLVITLLMSVFSASAYSDEFETLVQQLPHKNLRNITPVLTQIAEQDNEQVRFVLTEALNGDLYYLKSNKQVVSIRKTSSGDYTATQIIGGQVLQNQSKSDMKKIKTSNSIRSEIRGLLAQIDLTHKNKNVRLGAVKQILDDPSDDSINLIKARLTQEEDADVVELIETAIAVNQLKNADDETKLATVEQLKQSLEPAVRNAMVAQINRLNEIDASELSATQKQLKNELNKAIESIKQQRSVYEFIENLFFGLSLGSVLLLAAIGLAITFGVMGVINMAHGEMIMLGAYTTYVIQQMFPQWIDYSLFIAIPAAFLVSGFVGILIERGVIRFLKGRPLETLLATFGISLILQQLVRSVFSPLNRTVAAPEWMSGSWQINPIFSITFNRLYIVIFALTVFFALLAFMKRSSLGLHVRAVAQNREMARALSVRSDRVDAITFGLGSGIAGIAGVVLSQLTNVGPNLGQSYIIDSFLVVVFGGVGNLWGTLVAAMSLGTINKFLEPVTGSVLATIIVLVGLVLFIQKRPKGLFPQKGRAAE